MNRRNQSGFTLVESIVAMVLMVIVTGLVVSTYLFATRAVGRWQRGLDLENTAHLIGQRLATDLRQAEMVRVLGPDSLVVDIPGHVHPTFYVVRDSSLFRNEVPMLPAGLALMDFRVQRRSEDDEDAPPDSTVRYLEVSFELAGGQRTARRVVAATGRTGEDWPAESTN